MLVHVPATPGASDEAYLSYDVPQEQRPSRCLFNCKIVCNVQKPIISTSHKNNCCVIDLIGIWNKQNTWRYDIRVLDIDISNKKTQFDPPGFIIQLQVQQPMKKSQAESRSFAAPWVVCLVRKLRWSKLGQMVLVVLCHFVPCTNIYVCIYIYNIDVRIYLDLHIYM